MLVARFGVRAPARPALGVWRHLSGRGPPGNVSCRHNCRPSLPGCHARGERPGMLPDAARRPQGCETSGSSGLVNLSSANQGQHTLYVQAWDNAGNASTVVSVGWFGYDTVAPSNPISISPNCSASNNIWQNTCADPNFTWSGASDGKGSGVKDYHYYWGASSVEWILAGNVVYAQFRDRAGNVSQVYSSDTAPPSPAYQIFLPVVMRQ